MSWLNDTQFAGEYTVTQGEYNRGMRPQASLQAAAVSRRRNQFGKALTGDVVRAGARPADKQERARHRVIKSI